MGAPRSRSRWRRARRRMISAPPLPSETKRAARIESRGFDSSIAPGTAMGAGENMGPSTIGGINKLPEEEKRAIYARYVPQELIQKFGLPPLIAQTELLQFRFAEGSSDVEMRVYHQAGF